MRLRVIILLAIFLLSMPIYSQSFVDFSIDTSINTPKACDSMILTFTDASFQATSYFWDFGDGTTSTLNPVTKTFYPGSYKVTHSINNNNTITDSVRIIINASPVASFIDSSILNTGSFSRIFIDKSLKDTLNNPTYTYTLDYGDNSTFTGSSPNVIKKYMKADSFYVKMVIKDNLSCVDSSTIGINILDFDELTNLPNIFTPNNDGTNDVFIINANGQTMLYFEVFNRSGELIFKSEAKTITWDGKTLSGTEAPTGLYYYILTSEKGHYKTVNQTIRLFRENN